MALQPADYLWENLCALTGLHDPSIDAMHVALQKCVSRGTVQRIKEREGHRATDVLREIADVLGVEVWQLLMPGVTTRGLQTTGGTVSPFSQELLDAAAKAGPKELRRAENAARSALDLVQHPGELGEFSNSDAARNSPSAKAA